MNRLDIFRRLVDIISEQTKVKPDDINEATLLRDDLGIDSFAALDLSFAIEETFKLDYLGKDPLMIRSVGELCNLVTQKLHAVEKNQSIS